MSANQKILVVRYSALGDVVLATSVLDPLLATFPGARIDQFIADAGNPDPKRGMNWVGACGSLESGISHEATSIITLESLRTRWRRFVHLKACCPAERGSVVGRARYQGNAGMVGSRPRASASGYCSRIRAVISLI